MRTRTLLTQVLAVNALLVVVTSFVTATVARDRLADAATLPGLLLLALCVTSAILLNSLLLRRRLEPIEELVARMDAADLSGAAGATPATVPRRASHEVQRLSARFNAMLGRLEEERREAGSAVLRAQEQERRRLAQDLHDEVNQALTGILLRLEATIGDAPDELRAELRETKALANQAMEELLALARQLRPTALDDHGLVPALASQVTDFGDRTGIKTSFVRHGAIPALSDEQQLVVYRITQESLSNIAQHAEAGTVDVELSFVGRTVLRVCDDGRGFTPGYAPNGAPQGRRGGLGLSGMRERALLVGGDFSIYSRSGGGTTIELTLGV
jgi:two-component system, NarL family, sensor histidine kinase UhpB